MINLKYEDLISGEPIKVDGVGYIRSPYLWELKPKSGIGMDTYKMYLNLLAWDKTEFTKIMRITSGKKLKAIDNEKLSYFDIITILKNYREPLLQALAFFMEERLVWNEEKRQFDTFCKDTDEVVGCISRGNFDDVRGAMLQMNYIKLEDKSKPQEYGSEKAKALWEKAQIIMAKEAQRKGMDKKNALGNIISKLCVASNTYNLFNIYNLTVFQLYDQFFQYGYLRAMNLNEMAFSTHGGDKFSFEAWLDPIFKE